MAALCLLPIPASAGHYTTQPVYSGGHVSCWPQGPPGGSNYGASNGGWGGSFPAAQNVACTGLITATFDWIPDNNDPADIPPDNVVVCETCTASSGGWGIAPPDCQANNGLGSDTARPAPAPDPQHPGNVACAAVSQGTRYTVVAGTNPLNVTCSPSASVTAGGLGNASVWYTCSVDPVTVSFSGGIGPTYRQRYLIGLHVTATLAGGMGLQPDASGCTWTVCAGKPFKDFNPDATDSHFVPLNTGTEKAATIGYYYGEGRLESWVTCAATLAVPAGCHPAAGLPVYPTRSCSLEEPAWAHEETYGSVKVDARPPGTAPPWWLILVDASMTYGGQQLQGCGTYWKANVETPAEWVQQYGQGNWAFVSLVADTSSITRTDGRVCPWSLTDTVLDGPYPYGTAQAADGINYCTNDSPGIRMTDTRRSIAMQEAFCTYLLYRPTGGRWVPLACRAWSPAATITRNGDGSWPTIPPGPPPVLTGTVTERPYHPVWHDNIDNGRFTGEDAP